MSTISEKASHDTKHGSRGIQRRLDSWKEIAVYLRRDVRTVQRWERNEGLPIHRLFHRKASSVYAYPEQIEAWLDKRCPPGGRPAAAQESTPDTSWISRVLAQAPLRSPQATEQDRTEDAKHASQSPTDIVAAGRVLEAVLEAKGSGGRPGKPIRMSLFVACPIFVRARVFGQIPQKLGWACLLLPEGARVWRPAQGAEGLLGKEGHHGLPN
jgi:hypothetical protein